MADENKIITLYRKKAIELIESRFSKSIQNSGVTISGKLGQPVKAERRGPDLEAIKAFAITYRNFSLDSDPISIRNIAKMYDKLHKDNQVKKEFIKIREALNQFLNSATILNINGKIISRKDLIDTYIYGQIIHLKKNEEFEQWIKGTPLGEIVYNEIVYTLSNLANFIIFIDTSNQDLLKEIS